MPNENCLEGIRCPKCKSEGPFEMRATCLVDVTDDGTDNPREFDWDDYDCCKCKACSFKGTVANFKIAT